MPHPMRQMLYIMVMGVWAGVFWSTPPVVAEDTGTITGQVRFTGTPPAPVKLEFGAEKQCALLHGDHQPVKEDLVVNAQGGVKYVLVYVTGVAPDGAVAPSQPVVFEQKGCVFLPHVAAVMAGQPVEVRNDDPVLHNVRAQSKQGQSFNIAQPVQGMKTTKVLNKPEIGIPLKCDVHFWMTAYLHVLPHPFFAMTGEDGRFAIAGVPSGTYTLEAWHEKLGVQTHTVALAAGESKSVTIEFASP